MGIKTDQLNSHTIIKSFHWTLHLDHFISSFGLVNLNLDCFPKLDQNFRIWSKIENGNKTSEFDQNLKVVLMIQNQLKTLKLSNN